MEETVGKAESGGSDSLIAGLAALDTYFSGEITRRRASGAVAAPRDEAVDAVRLDEHFISGNSADGTNVVIRCLNRSKT
jgi:hypothetical protein